ncbi:MAG: DUF948 domain-containing protein [Cyanobacteria bacterium J06559_1]
MKNPFFWLGISILLVAISLMALLTVAIFVLQELARAARSAEKLLDTLNKELPATLQELRTTGQDLSGLTDEVAGSVQSARSVVSQVDKGLSDVKVHTRRAQITTRSLIAGTTAALQVLIGKPRRRRRPPTRRPTPHRPSPKPTAKDAVENEPATTVPAAETKKKLQQHTTTPKGERAEPSAIATEKPTTKPTT